MSKGKVPKVSVVLPVYNAEAFVGEVLVTILEQSFSDFEVIVVDDGSRDKSAEVVKKYAEMDKRIRYYHQKNRGSEKLGSTLNYGVSLARAELIARADSDDPWMLDRLERQVAYMKEHPKCVLCGGGAEIVDEGGRHVWTLISPSSDEDIRREMTIRTPLNHGGVMFRKSTFTEAGEYRDMKYVEDLDLWVRMSRLGNLYNFPEAMFRYRKNTAGISLSNEDAQKQAVEAIGREYWKESTPKYLSWRQLKKKLAAYDKMENGGALCWVFLENTLIIGARYAKWDRRLLKGLKQIVAVALSSRLGFKLFAKKTLQKHVQKIKFALVGVANTVIDFGLFAVLANAMGIVAEAASLVSTGVAMIFSFFANYYYVWKSKKSKAKTIPQFFAVTIFTAWGVQTGIIWAVKQLVGDGGWENILAKVCAVGVGMVVNYLLYKVIFLGKKRHEKN